MNNNIKLKYGIYSISITAIVFVIIIVINLVVGQLNLKYDFTKDKLYSLSEQTYEILKNLDKEVDIYALYETGYEDLAIKQILNNYSSKSSNISIEFIDLNLNPEFAMEYSISEQELEMGTIIVKSYNRYKIIFPDEMATYGFDYNTNMTYMESLNVESCISGAISYVSSEEIYKIYSITGHSESYLSDKLINQLNYENYEIEILDLSSGEIPEDTSLILINYPQEDFSEYEIEIINNYLNNNGRAFVNIGVTSSDMTRFNSLMANYGIKCNLAMTIEGAADYVYQNNPYYLLPKKAEHEITNQLDENSIFFPYAQGIEELETKRNSLNIMPLLFTSDESYAKTSISSIENFAKSDEDLNGPFNLAVAITDEQTASKIIVIGGSAILDTDINTAVNGGNFDFVVNSINWLENKQSGINVLPKTIEAVSYLQMTQTQVIIIMTVSVIIIPVFIFVFGIYTVIKRKNK